MNAALRNILSSPWLLYSEHSEIYGAMLVSLLKGETIHAEDYSIAREKNRSFVLCAADSMGRTVPMNSDAIPCGSIAVIPIQGEIMADDQQCGVRGAQSINSDIKTAEANPNIQSIVLKVNSPGGQTTFIDTVSETISKCKKPVVAYVEGMAASASYWLISGADKIICSSSLDQLGSIGAMLMWADVKGMLEADGVVVHELYATLSTEKNLAIDLLRKGDDQAVRESLLDPINAKFHSTVTANRSNLDPSTLKGNIFYAPDAIALGLADEIGSFDYALQSANTISSKNIIRVNNSNLLTMSKMLPTWTAIAAFFHLTGDTSATDLTPEMISQMNDRMADQNTTIETVNAENIRLMQVESNFNTLQSVHSEQTRLFDEQTRLFAEQTRLYDALKAEDAGKETKAGKPGDRTAEQLISDKYSYNVAADEQL